MIGQCRECCCFPEIKCRTKEPVCWRHMHWVRYLFYTQIFEIHLLTLLEKLIFRNFFGKILIKKLFWSHYSTRVCRPNFITLPTLQMKFAGKMLLTNFFLYFLTGLDEVLSFKSYTNFFPRIILSYFVLVFCVWGIPNNGSIPYFYKKVFYIVVRRHFGLILSAKCVKWDTLTGNVLFLVLTHLHRRRFLPNRIRKIYQLRYLINTDTLARNVLFLVLTHPHRLRFFAARVSAPIGFSVKCVAGVEEHGG